MYKKILEKLDAQKVIEKQQKKYKNKKVIIYGAGQYTRYIFENYDLSGFNIVAVADLKFDSKKNEKFYGYKTISPKEIKDENFDIILLSFLEESTPYQYLKSHNLESKADMLINPTLITCIKLALEEKFENLIYRLQYWLKS